MWIQTICTCIGPGFGENRSHLGKSGLLLEERNLIIMAAGNGSPLLRKLWQTPQSSESTSTDLVVPRGALWGPSRLATTAYQVGHEGLRRWI